MFLVQILQHDIGDQRNIFLALAQWRNYDLEYAQPIVEFFSQMRSDFLTGRGKYPNVHCDFVFTAKPPHPQVLENAQQLGLRRLRHLADLVEKQSAPVGLLKATGGALHGARKRAFLVAEQFALNQSLGQGGCIDRDERAIAAGAAFMDFPGNQFLSGATLSADQYGRRGGRNLSDEREGLQHRWGGSYQVPEYAAKTQFARESVGLLQTSFVANRAIQKDFEGARFHRLLQEPECLEVMDGGKRLVHTAEAGERDRRGEIAAFLQVPEQFKPSMRGMTKSATMTSAWKAVSRSSASCPSAAT